MKKQLQALVLTSAFLMPAVADAQPSTDPRVVDIVRAGKLRVGVHLPQFVREPKTGEIHGHGTGAVIVPIATALAERIGVKLELVGHASPPVLIKCLQDGGCDAGFLGYVPARTKQVDYAPPHILVPFTYLVPPGSAIRSAADADKPGLRIAVVRNHASTHALERIVKHARLVDVEIPDQAFELIRSGQADAYASPRPPILEYAGKLPGSRVLDDRYGANIQAIALPKGQAARVAYVSEFVEAAKASGLVQRAIDSVGGRGIAVAPAGNEILTGSVPAKH